MKKTKRFVISLLSLFILTHLYAQVEINVNNIEIVRDDYGVPHIFTKTDLEAIYGIAWAQCEDNFHLMQENFAATKGMAGRLMGKNGAVLDLIFEVFKVEEFVESRYKQDVNPEYEKMLWAYAQAVNQYANLHPKEVRSNKIFPLTPKKILEVYSYQMLLLHNSVLELGKLLDKNYDYALMEQAAKGSNAMAYSPNITEDGKTYLVGNPHQPVNTMGNFWEVSVHSEEGYDIHGVTFSVGGLTPVIGTNKNLGWSHTTNYQNTADIYQLEMHPTKKYHYKYDGEWLPLEVKKAKLKVKVGPLVIPVGKKYYWSAYGPTFEKESGFYSYKSSVFYNIRLPEQWYKMGLAKNMEEFMEAVNIQGLPAQTITYADKEGNIYHLSNFNHPYRNEKFDWSTILDGSTSENNWDLKKIHPVSDLPQIKNPKCGYVYNCNNTVYKMTAPNENLKPADFPKGFVLPSSNTIRANSFANLIQKYDKISFEEARKIRENIAVDKNDLSFRNFMNGDQIPKVFNKYPELSELKRVFDKWDGSYDINNKQASLMAVSSLYFIEYIKKQLGNVEKDIPEVEIVNAMLKAEKFLKKHYGSLEVELGEIQKAIRHGVEYPMYGGPNTLANAHFEFHKKSKLKLEAGDSYIFYAKYGKDGLEELETINAFGNSLKKGHPHSTDQTEMYVNMKTKTAELNLEKLKKVGKMYHPK